MENGEETLLVFLEVGKRLLYDETVGSELERIAHKEERETKKVISRAIVSYIVMKYQC